jgi:hypothetical protein
VASAQEDCGATYRQFTTVGDRIEAQQFCYFPGAGASSASFARSDSLRFHDALSLTLRDYPFEDHRTMEIQLVADQTDTHETNLRPRPARVSYVARDTLDLPYGRVEAHHLRVDHEPDGSATGSDYWFAADDALRHVMVKYAGPYGVRYDLKKLGWWAYWDQGQAPPGS